MTLEVARRERKTNGEWGKLKNQRLYSRENETLTDPADRRVAAFSSARARISAIATRPTTIRASRCSPCRKLWESAAADVPDRTLFLAQSASWMASRRLSGTMDRRGSYASRSRAKPTAQHYRLTGMLRRDEAELDLAQPVLLLAGGLVFYDGRIARLERSWRVRMDCVFARARRR